MELKSIKLDTAFPEWGTTQLEEALNEGMIIYDKQVGKRYVVYIMAQNPELEDVGKAK